MNQSGSPTSFNDEIDFTVSNTFNWSLEGTAQLTFGGSASAAMTVELQQSLASSLAQTMANTHIDHNHQNDVGTEDRHETETVTTNTTTETGTGSATGTGEVDAQLLLGITGSVSGSLYCLPQQSVAGRPVLSIHGDRGDGVSPRGGAHRVRVGTDFRREQCSQHSAAAFPVNPHQRTREDHHHGL
ncbi:hypothetical protein [Chromobacterium violaceum]|uniref:hypothetical protein n=1 Tax=Chromobacterium violaceum TaxID=536 RepID=UPI001EF243B8|nr:hypothetical protein [Chromobacterium violaceum]